MLLLRYTHTLYPHLTLLYFAAAPLPPLPPLHRGRLLCKQTVPVITQLP
jgi:hypothetical protein